MGTRSLTTVFNERDKPLVTIYRQMDGFPDSHGMDLAVFLAPKKLTNGFSPGSDPRETANGMEDLAAQLVADLKAGFPLGGIYLMTPGIRGAGEEYTYEVRHDDGAVKLVAYEVAPVGYSQNETPLFEGGPSAFIETYGREVPDG